MCFYPTRFFKIHNSLFDKTNTDNSPIKKNGLESLFQIIELEFLTPKKNLDQCIVNLFEGVLRSLFWIKNSRKEISSLISGFIPSSRLISRIPFRSTEVYKSKINTSNSDTFMKEELEQLTRGDVPYFFKFLDGNEDIFFWENQNTFKRILSEREMSIPIPKSVRHYFDQPPEEWDEILSFIIKSLFLEIKMKNPSKEIFHSPNGQLICKDQFIIVNFENFTKKLKYT